MKHRSKKSSHKKIIWLGITILGAMSILIGTVIKEAGLFNRWATATDTNVTSQQANALPPAIDTSWRLTFDDEFNGSTINSLWRDGGVNWGSGGNGEKQGYVMNDCKLENGILRIIGEKKQVTTTKTGHAPQTYQYSSCMINTIGTFNQTYGYFEFRGKLVHGQGYWPAFWLFDSTYQSNAEIDVMENLGRDTNTYYMTYHSGGQQQKTYRGADLAQGYHTYAIKWTPSNVIFYFDDVQQYSVGNNFNGKMFILVNLAIGGSWGGDPDASTVFPGEFDVDFVRAYAMPGDTSNPPITMAPTTPQPTAPQTTASPAGGSQSSSMQIFICPHGLLTCGDNANPQSIGTPNPLHTSRSVTVTFYDASNQIIATKQTNVTFNSTANTFEGSVDTSNIPSGNYIVTVKMQDYLATQLPGIQTITRGQNIIVPKVSATTGDINDDNKIDILDYNLFISCFGSKVNTQLCQAKTSSDLNDDGKPDGADYNLLIREVSVQSGSGATAP